MTVGIASTNRVQHGYVRETTYATTPASPAIQALRVTGSTVSGNPVTVESDELRSDRQVPDLIRVGTQAKGDVNYELSFNAQDADLEEAVQGAWTLKPNVVNTGAGAPISALSTTTATVASGGAAFVAQMIALMTGFATAANNKTAIVSSSSGTSIVFPSATFTADASPQAGAIIRQVGFQGASGDITATSTGLASTLLNFTAMNIVAGEWIKIGGVAAGTQFATTANNGWARISAVAANALTFDILPAGWSTDSGASKTISVFCGDYLRNGVVQRSRTIEKQFLDLATPSYEYLRGMVIDTMTLTIAGQAVVKGAVSYVGSTPLVQTSRISGATDIPAPNYAVLNGSDDVGRIGVSGVADTGPDYVLEATISLANNVRPAYAVNNLGAVGMPSGSMVITGSLNTYFGDVTNYNNVLNQTPFGLDFRLIEPDTNQEGYVIDMPYCKASTSGPTAPGKNQNVMLPLNYQALRSTTYGYEIHIGRYWCTSA